ncbi:MAG: MarR family transcriptional regulator [Devosiaceae bacterium]|nr:MarR family transcriptional regulator [Devosiaceae bacterium MH13]
MTNAQDDEIQDLISAFDRFGPLYARFINGALREADTSPSRLRLLRVLDELGPTPMQGLADALCIAPRTVTGLVDGLEEEGLVLRKAHATDRRTKLIETTAAGRMAFQRSQRRYEERLADLLRTLPQETRRAMLAGHLALIERLSSRAG